MFSASPNRPDNPIHAANRTPLGGLLIGCVKPIAAPVVVTATLAVAPCNPSSVTELGVTVHVECAGASLQLSDTDCLNPLSGVRVTE
jgi:hypothetical protein